MRYFMTAFALAVVAACSSTGTSPAPEEPVDVPPMVIPTEEERQAAIENFCTNVLPNMETKPPYAVEMCK